MNTYLHPKVRMSSQRTEMRSARPSTFRAIFTQFGKIVRMQSSGTPHLHLVQTPKPARVQSCGAQALRNPEVFEARAATDYSCPQRQLVITHGLRRPVASKSLVHILFFERLLRPLAQEWPKPEQPKASAPFRGRVTVFVTVPSIPPNLQIHCQLKAPSQLTQFRMQRRSSETCGVWATSYRPE